MMTWKDPLTVCFHTFRCHSPRVLRRSECLDYFGILVFAGSAFLPVIYFLFRCDTLWRHIYLSALLILSIGILFLISWEPFSRDEYRIYKVIAFSRQGITLWSSQWSDHFIAELGDAILPIMQGYQEIQIDPRFKFKFMPIFAINSCFTTFRNGRNSWYWRPASTYQFLHICIDCNYYLFGSISWEVGFKAVFHRKSPSYD